MTQDITPEELRHKLARAVKAKAVLTERTKQLRQQLEDFRKREDVMNHVAYELLERQREVNYMLHRASSVLHQLQDTNLAIAGELTHLAGELPPAEDPKWEDTVSKVNELFERSRRLASEAHEEITRGIPGEKAREAQETPVATAPPEAVEEPTEVEEAPPPAEAPAEPESDIASDAELQEIEQAAAELEDEQVDTPGPEPTSDEVSEEEDAIEQFFKSIQCDDSGRITGKVEAPPQETPRKRGFFARLGGLFRGVR